MSNYNLSDNVNDGFNFELRGNKYTMRYPITEEVEQIQDITERLQAAQDAKDNDEAQKLSKQLEEYLYGFISPEGHDTPIREALLKENIKVMKNFNTMIKTELSIS